MTRYYVRKSIRRWAFLEPWCAFVREYAELQVLHDHKGDLMLCVRLRPEPSEPLTAYDERVRYLREALELLTMVAFVDVVAWQDLLRDKCGCARAPFWDDWRLPLGIWLKLGDAKLATLTEHDTRFYRAFFAPFCAPVDAEDESTTTRAAARERAVVSHTARMAMQAIVSEMTPAMHEDVRSHGAVEVCMRFIPRRGLEAEQVPEYLESVVATVRECLAVATVAHDDDDVALQYMSKLALTDTELHIGAIPLPAGTAQLLADFVMLGTNTTGFYPVLDLGPHTALGKLPLVELEPFLQAIATRVSTANQQIASGRATFPRNDESYSLVGLTRLDNTPQTSHAYARRFKALFSTLATSKCFDQLSLEGSIGYASSATRGKKWQWLAYALLSKDSTAGVMKLTLSESGFRQADMNAIVSILNTRNPARKLGGVCRTRVDYARLEAEWADPRSMANEWANDLRDDSTTGENDEDPDVRAFYATAVQGEVLEAATSDHPSFATVRSGTTLRVAVFDSERGLGEPEAFVLSTEGTFRVIKDNPKNDWVGILVPCYGYCTTARDAVVLAKSTEASRAETSISWGYRGSIRCLRLNPTASLKLAFLLPLLRYLGSQLVALETTDLVDLDATNLRQVLEACPRLETLNACLSHGTIDSELLTAYAEERCRVSDLRLNFFSRTDQALKFVRTLQDRTSRAAQIVEKLTVLSDPDEPLDRVVLSAILEMLESNVVLELLQVEVSLEHMKEFKPLFMKFHGQVISGVREPFPIKCRTAFLSVVAFFSKVCASPPKRQRGVRVTAQIGQLDRGVVALIFQFAAERKSRRVHVFETEL